MRYHEQCLSSKRPNCKGCGKELVTFSWENIITTSCTNPRCTMFKQPQNIERGEKYGENGKREKNSSQKVREEFRLS
jgi:hypothetical protein